MKLNPAHITPRLVRKALTSICRHKVAAAGVDNRGRVIAMSTNRPRYSTPQGGWHAEELLLYRTPLSLARIVIVRVNRSGKQLAISPCRKCARLAAKRGVTIEAA